MTLPAITIQDTGSSTASGEGSQVLITGTPTAGSVVQASVTGTGAFGIALSGTWTGTVAFESSQDGGVTWVAQDVFVEGIDSVIQSATANGVFKGTAAADSQIRARATAAMTGSAAVQILGTTAADLHHVIVLNASNITIGNVGGKAANGAALSGNPVLVGGSDGTDARNLSTDSSGNLHTKNVKNIVQKNPTVTASAYSANNVVGGIQTLTGLLAANGYGVLDSVSVIDAAAQGAELTLLFFKALPTGGTYTDKGALTLAAADLPNFLGEIVLAAANYQLSGTGVKTISLTNIGLDLVGDSSGNVYVIALTTGTPTYTLLCLNFNYGVTQS